MRIRGALLATSLLLAPLASAYYHFVVYLASAPNTPVLTRFDTSALPGNRLPLLIRETGPVEMASGDTFTSLISQIRAAAEVWNTVETSNLKVTFGGLSSDTRPMASPHIEVVFEELQPGVIAMGGPTNKLDPVTGEYGTFVPIVKSQVVLPINLASPVARPVYTEKFFLTLVHELGHALGLQHSWSGGIMATEITRTTSKASPLILDDAVALSILYPAERFRAKTINVTGRVSLENVGVHLASVTAVTPGGPAVSTLTNPDGSYKLEGLATGSYYLYAQPLPPSLVGETNQPVNLNLPVDPSNPENLLLPGPVFNTAFFPGDTSTPQIPVSFATEGNHEAYDFNVRSLAKVNLHSVQTYTFLGQEAIKPATMVMAGGISPLILYGYGMTTGTAPMPGLGVSLLSAKESVAPNGVYAYPYSTSYIQVDIQKAEDAIPGHRHLIFTLNGETHVAPSALRIQRHPAPVITALAANADGTVTIEGGEFQQNAVVLFDGARGTAVSTEATKLVALPPAAPFGHKAVVSVLNPDGQSTLMSLGANSPVYTYEAAQEPVLEFTPSTVPAGVETIIELAATGMNLTAAGAQVAFGTSEVTVLNMIPLSETKALVHISVSQQASPAAAPVAVWKGLRRTAAAAQLQIGAVSTAPYVVMSRISGGKPYAGGELIVPVANLPESAAPETTAAQIGGLAAIVTAVDRATGLVSIAVPAGAPAGPANLDLAIAGQAVLPAVVTLTAPPVQAVKVQTIHGVDITAQNAPSAGTLIQVLVKNLPDLGAQPDFGRFLVSSGAVDHTVVMILPVAGAEGYYNVVFLLNAATPSGTAIPLVVSFEGKPAGELSIPVR